MATKVGYAIPTLNSVSTLGETLLHLLTQKHVQVEILVIDSGSTDGTLELCKKWKIKTLYVPPGNIYTAINFGIKQLSTDWVSYINSDDYLYTDGVSRLLDLGNKNNANIVYGNSDFVDEEGRFIYSYRPAMPHDLASIARTGAPPFSQQSVIFRKELFEELGGFDEKYKLAADKDFFFRAIKQEAKFAFLSGLPVACFRLHKNQLSKTQASQLKQEGIKITSSLFESPTLNDWLNYITWKLKNFPHYTLRLFRQSLLSGKIQYSSSIYNYLISNSSE